MWNDLSENGFEEIAVKRILPQELDDDVRASNERSHHPADLATHERENTEPQRNEDRHTALRLHTLPQFAHQCQIAQHPCRGKNGDVRREKRRMGEPQHLPRPVRRCGRQDKEKDNRHQRQQEP